MKKEYEQKYEECPQELIDAKDALLRNNQLLRKLALPFRAACKPRYIKDMSEYNYEAAKKVDLIDFYQNGSGNDYQLVHDKESEVTLTCTDIVEVLLLSTKKRSTIISFRSWYWIWEYSTSTDG